MITAEGADHHDFLSPGQILVSSRHTNLVALLDLDRRRVLRTWNQDFGGQHDPKILPGGSMLVFDNQRAVGASRVLELDVETSEIVWQYRGDVQNRLFSPSCGAAERLANGNTLISESDAGRAVEVTPEGEIVWEFLSPHRVGENREYVATLFEVLRVPADTGSDWAGR